ncbi:hypothetical protein Cdeb_01771 [Caldibacillus debilis GB1]|uniref:Uncharacterized protein n=1 Tax=Caldibacillus debilis GB1 TaxID=1339248 RepID=A0A420VCC5_9BACI|nr:hypothetical protein Cdeb_01771 [Caldibacillus debilis GB1]
MEKAGKLFAETVRETLASRDLSFACWLPERTGPHKIQNIEKIFGSNWERMAITFMDTWEKIGTRMRFVFR